MTKTIWYIFKPGDVRDYATPTPPAETWAASLRKEGFRIVEVTFAVPVTEISEPDGGASGTVRVGAS